MQTVIIIEFVIYLLGMLWVGAYFSKKQQDPCDFHLGGKKLPGWALALSERATGESAWLILGLSGFAYTAGYSSIWIAVGCVSGIIISWLWLARHFRAEAEKYNALTMSDYFAKKFPQQGSFIRWFSSIIIIFFYTLYVVAQFNGGGKTIGMTFGLPEIWGILLSSVVVIMYSMAGGFCAVVYTDAIQAILMMVTFLVTPIIAIVTIFKKGLSLTTALNAAGNINTFDSWTGGLVGFAAGVMIFNNLAWIFGYLGGQPQLNSRWMAMKDDKQVKIGMWIAVSWTILAYAGVILTGLAAVVLFGPKAVSDPETILPFMLLKLMPPWLAGLVLTGAVAAMMSTASSQLLVVTSAVSEDVIHKAMKKEVTDKKLVLISRISIMVIGLAALGLSFTNIKVIYTVVGWAWAGIGCSFAPAVILSFFWKRFNGYGVAASLITGFTITVIWMTTGLDSHFTARAASFIFAFAAAVIAALVFEKKTAMRSNG